MMAGCVETNPGPRPPPELSLFNLSKELSKLTKPILFAVHLGIPQHVIDCIERENNRVANQNIDIFKYIADNNRSANITWASIADALEGAQAGNLAVMIRTKFVTNCSSRSEPKNASVPKPKNIRTANLNGGNSATRKHLSDNHRDKSYVRHPLPHNPGGTSYVRDPLPHNPGGTSYVRDPLPRYPRDTANLNDLGVAPNSPDHTPRGCMECLKWMIWMIAILTVTAVVASLLVYVWRAGLDTLTDPLDGHPIAHIQELHKATKDIPGLWEPLCENLHVQAGVISNLVSTELDPTLKMRRCLKAYYNRGDVYWEEVILAIAGSPINNRRLAKKIATTHRVDFNMLMKKEEL